MNKKMTIQDLSRRAMLMLLAMAAVVSLLIPQANAASVPGISSSKYLSCYTISASGRVYAYTDSSLTKKTGGYIDCATDECRLIAFTSTAVQVSYPVPGGRRIAWFPRSAFTAFDLKSTSYTAVTASGKVTTYPRSSGSKAYGYISGGDRVVILGTSGGRTQVIYNVGSHYKMAWVETSQVSKYLTGGSSGAVTPSGTYTIYTALGGNLVLDVSNNSSGNGANIQIFTANGTSAQIFHIIPVGGEWCKIIHAGSGKAVDVAGGNAASQVNCHLWEDNGSDAQRWRFIPCGGGYLIQSKLGCYLDVAGGNAAACNNVWLYTGNQSQAQIWKLSQVSGSSVTQQVTAKLNQMMNGSFAGGTYQVNTTYRGPYYTEQCKGFAKAVFQNLFGYNIGSTKNQPNNYQINIDTSKTRQVGTLTSLSSRSDSELKNLLTQARPGDFLQVRRSHGGSHSMIVLGTSASGITVYECNVDGANRIRTATYSWASFRSVNAAVGLYTARDYSLHC